VTPRSLAGVAGELGLSPSTLRRWVAVGLIDQDAAGEVTERGAAQARVVQRLRERGYSLADIRRANERGVLASSHIEALAGSERRWTIGQAAREVGLSRKLAQRLLAAVGVSGELRDVGTLELELLRAVAAVLESGVPLPVVLQVARVYGQAISQIADAEVRLIHHHVHEPMMRSGLSGKQVVDQMQGLVTDVLPLTSPLLGLVHHYYLREFTEQDVIGHMEELQGGRPPEAASDSDGDQLTRVRVAVAFADLAGYTRLTEELGDARAVDTVERFVAAVASSLPSEARVIKTIGDEAMIVSPDVAGLVQWAVRFQQQSRDQDVSARIGVHCGQALFYEGDYYGREVNLASRVAARAGGGEVVVTAAIAEAKPAGVRFERLGEIRLKGFSSPTEILLAQGVADHA